MQVQRDKLSKAMSNAQKAIADFDKTIADADKAIADEEKARANMNKVIVQYQQSSFCRNTITPLISFIESPD